MNVGKSGAMSDIRQATHVKVGGKWKEIRDKWGISQNGRLAKPKPRITRLTCIILLCLNLQGAAAVYNPCTMKPAIRDLLDLLDNEESVTYVFSTASVVQIPPSAPKFSRSRSGFFHG